MARRNRPELKTREELIAYLEANPDTELPFNEVVWDKAVEFMRGKESKSKTITTSDFDGTVKKRVVPNGAISPTGKYFQLMALPQYSRPVVDSTEEEFGEHGVEVDDDIINGFAGYLPQERKFLVDRLSEYYENYEINTGSDKFIVRQIVVYELELNRLNVKMAAGKDVYSNIEKVTKQYLALCESLKTLKKQRGAMEDEGKNKFTQFMDTLEKEGDFKPTFDAIDDGIERMLDSFERSIMKVFNEG